MEKEELLNKIAEAFGAGNKEIKIAYDAFLQKISEELSPEEAVKIPDFGVFQIKPKTVKEPFDPSSENTGNPPYRLLYFPDNSNDVVELDFSFSGKSKKNSPESAFSLSAGKPIIPILESQKKELMIQSSYINLLNDFRDKADVIFSDAVKLDNFNIEGTEVKPDIFINSNDISIDEVNEPGGNDESIPWNFGDVLNDELNKEEVTEEPEPANDEENAAPDTFDVPDEQIQEEEYLSDNANPESDEVLPNSENMEEGSSQNQDFDIDINNLGDDFFNLSASDLGLDDENKDESKSEEDEQPAELVGENVDDALLSEQAENDEEEAAGDESYEDEESGVEEEDGEEEEEKNQEEVISIDVNKAHEFSSSRNIPLEEVESPEDVDVQYSKWFWIVLVSLVFITFGGIYYFFFYKSSAESNVDKQAAAKTHKVTPQIVERNYEVPVSVIPKGKDETPDKVTENPTDNNTAANTQAKTENKNSEKTVPEKNVQEKTTAAAKSDNAKTSGSIAQKGNEKDQKNKPAAENVKPTQQQNVPKQVTPGTAAVSSFERKDNKNTLVKNYIFSDGNKYTIQLSSWKSREIAEKEVKRLRKQGLDAYFTESYVPSVGGTWYRVRVGEFYTIQGAEDALEKIK